MLGCDGFGVKLHPMDRQGSVLQAHDRTVLKVCSDLKAVGQGGLVNDQRMKTRCRERAGQTGKQSGAAVFHDTHLAMHDLVAAHHLAAERLADGLMPKADPQQRHAPLCRGARKVKADPGAIVDQFGRCHSIDNLVVADASIMPFVPRANTNLTCIMIGEKIGEWLRISPARYGI